MTTRRNLFKMAGLAATLPGAALAAEMTPSKATAEVTKTASKTFKGGVTLCEPLPNAPEMVLSKTLNPGKSTFNDGVVMNASHWGVYRVHVKGGKIERLDPVKEDKSPSMQLQAIAQQPYNAARIRYPMVRKSFLEKGHKAGGAGRGKEPFVRVSWDEALTLVAKEIERVEKTYGPASVFGGSYGWMSTSSIGNARNLMRRVLNCAGGFTSILGDYSTGCAQVILPYVIGASGVYEQVTAWDLVCEKTELIVLWGADPSVTNDIDWSTTFHENAEAFRRIRDKGIPCVAVNPLKPDTAEFLGEHCEWIAPKPNTDVAVMLAMCHELEASGKADHEFLRKYTVGADQFIAYLMGKEDGVAKTPAWAEKISGVPAETIKGLAHAMRDKRSMLMGGWGIQRAQFGEQVHWAMVALAAMCGHIGQPGGGFGFTYHYSNGGAATSEAPVLPGISSTPKGITPAVPQPIPLARFTDCFLNPGKVIEYNGTKITYPDIRLVFWSGGNPFGQQEDSNRLVKAWRKPETTIVTDIVWTASARMADIVLPACTSLERNDIAAVGSYSNLGYVAMQQAIEPQWESRSDYWIYSHLAEKLGHKDAFTEGLDEMGWIKRFYDAAAREALAAEMEMPSFDDFWKCGMVLFPVTEDSQRYNYFGDFRKNPITNPLGTESGKIELFSKKIASYHYDDCPGHPTWLEPTEWLGAKLALEYPFALLTAKSRYRLHSQLDSTASNLFTNIDEREPVWIHPDAAKKLGLENGDIALVESRHGKVLAGVLITDRVRPDTVVVHHGAWFCPSNPDKDGSLEAHGCNNTLTIDIPSSRLACGNVANTTLVRVKKYEGDLPPVYVHRQPKVAKRAA